MVKYIKFAIIISLWFPAVVDAVVPFIQPRSQSEDSARDLVGMTQYINLYDQEQFYGAIAVTPEYTHTFSPRDIAQNLFGFSLVEDEVPFVKITGSQVGDRNETDWLADYFGLPTDFESKIFVQPVVQNFIGDIECYLGLDQWQDGLYFRFHIPIVYTKWNLNYKEEIINAGVNGYDPGYFSGVAVPRSSLLNSFTDYTSGLVPQLGGGVTFVPLNDARIPTKSKSLVGVSEIQAAFGWNFLQGDDHHFGLNLRTAIPTGTRPKGEFLFEPLIGNGKHWELGLGMTGHAILFIDTCRNRMVSFYFDANITYLFATRQRRTFDLVENPLSRYILTEKIGTPINNLFINTMQGVAAGSVAPSAQFQNVYAPLANLFTGDVKVSINAQVDVTAMMNIRWCNWDIDFGYNFWARTCEQIKPCSPDSFDIVMNYALKGDVRTYGFVANDAVASPLPVGTPIPLSATESTATIVNGTNTPVGTPFDPTQNQNPGIDGGVNQWAMVDITDNADQIVILPGQDGGADTQQRSSLAPVLLQSIDADLESAETKGLSNRLFAHVNYNWDSCYCDCAPFTGIGGFIELAHHRGDSDCSDPDFDQSCQTVAFSQWGIWLKAGIAF